MAIVLSPQQLRLLRLRSQRLAPRSRLSDLPPEGVVQEVVAVQAQDAYAAVLSVWARGRTLTFGDVEHARGPQRSLVRTWCLRSTLHMLPAADLGWMLPLLGPTFVAGDARRRADLGLDDETCARGIALLRQVLAGGPPLTRDLVAARLADKGLPLTGQAVPHLLARAALEGVLCLGPDSKNKPTYVLLEEWLGPLEALPRAQALTLLARRYLEAYAPAAPADLAYWSGLPMPASWPK